MKAEWRDVPGLGGKYQVTADGRVRLVRELKPVKQGTGYLTVGIFPPGLGKQKVMSVHRLVALAWLANPKALPLVNHIDGNRANPAASNLEWCTHARNCQHAWDSGRARVTPAMRASLRKAVAASANKRRVISPESLLAARGRFERGERPVDIADSLGVPLQTLCSALSRSQKGSPCRS